MSTLKEITSQEEFSSHLDTLSTSTLLIISFHAPWAAPCAQMRTLLTTLASTYEPSTPPKISFVSIDAEALPDISESYNVTAVPFLVLQRDGKQLQSISGCDAAKVRGAIENHFVGAGSRKVELPPQLEVTPRPHSDANGTGNVTKDLSGYAPSSSDPQTAPDATGSAELPSNDEAPKTSEEELNTRIAELVKAAPVMLFMKGTPSSPECGFSRKIVGILREKGVRYGFFNILADEDVRQGLKVWADWPTFPQLWVGGELVGGLDIVSFYYVLDCPRGNANTRLGARGDRKQSRLLR